MHSRLLRLLTDRFEMFFHDLRGGRTEKTMPSRKGSSESTSSSSASPPSVIIWYISAAVAAVGGAYS